MTSVPICIDMTAQLRYTQLTNQGTEHYQIYKGLTCLEREYLIFLSLNHVFYHSGTYSFLFSTILTLSILIGTYQCKSSFRVRVLLFSGFFWTESREGVTATCERYSVSQSALKLIDKNIRLHNNVLQFYELVLAPRCR